ncbi:hypothetical protein V9T40_004611 [Parthenolecanium corni]|uniref:Uncharacterized protein n=1 Tax=Parthenolecanium corni TaxID=536013 RepID=A0AAN9Y8T1_9HEMI
MFDGHSVSGNEENEPKAKLGIHEFNADELDEVPQFVSTLKSNEADRESIDESVANLTSKHEDVQDERLPILYSSPQYYSVEALEIYYRVHSTILKILEVYEEKSLDNTTINILKIFVERMAESPFMSARLNRPPNVLDRLSVGIVYSGAKFRTSRKTENVGRRGYFENLLAHALSLNFATDSLSNGEGKAPKLVGRPRPFVSASSFL